jgi:osmotically-inducible protein OsmY
MRVMTIPETPTPNEPRRPAIPGWLIAAVLFGLVFALSGCGVVVGAGAGVGVAASQERGLEGKARDLKIEVQIAEAWLRTDHTYSVRMSIEVYEARVLLTGVVDDEKVRADAVRLAWTIDGVKEVLNEIQVHGGGDIVDFARDAWITASLKSTLTFDENVLAINYAIETVNGIIYLIGIAQDQKEMSRVLGHARSIKYVRKIVNHVRIKTRPA